MSSKPPCPDRCNVLLVGGGGREHALAWKLKQSPRLGALWLTDSVNAGLQSLGRPCPEQLDLKHPFRLQRWCDEQNIHLIVVGPEAPLAAGIADRLTSDSRLVFGPTKAGARLESDKAWAKSLIRSASVSTADAKTFVDRDAALAWLDTRDEALVVKASGLASGKGVVVCDTVTEAEDAVRMIMDDRAFGEAGETIVIEERLTGQEVSVLALTDGRTLWMLDPAQDHKQVGEGDTGPNTGGMGAYCPTPVLDDAMLARIERDILVPVVDAMKRDGIDYRGVLYAGLMLTPAGPKVLEFNCRFGDPECQALMARLQGDLVEILWATASRTLDSIELSFDPRTACCVVMCSDGYPGSYRKGLPITGLENAADLAGHNESIIIFHSGTRREEDGTIVTNGGRVLGVTTLADNIEAARDLANAACGRIEFDRAFFRRDIGHRVLKLART